MAKKYEKAFLEKVAEELNNVMALKPAIEVTMPDDETLLEHIKYEATGGGKEKAAIRALDFENPEDPKALVFSEKVADFLVEIGVWDRDEERVIMPKKSSEKEASAEGKPVSDAKTEKKPGKKDAKFETKEDEMPSAKPSKKTQVAKKRSAKSVPAKKVNAPKKDEEKSAVKKATVKKTTEKKAPADVDRFGFREGSTASKAIAFLATGKHTMSEAKEKFGGTFYSNLKKIVERGGKVTANDDSTFKISAKK